MAIVCSDPVIVENCQLCAQINIEQELVLSSGILITVTATVDNACVGNNLSMGAILCETIEEDEIEVSRVIATQVLEGIVTGAPGEFCADVTRVFSFLIADTCRPDGTPRVFRAAVAAHYVIDDPDCLCPCDFLDNGEED